MPVESWTRPEDVPTLAAEAIVQIDAVLTRLDAAARDAFWASIAKCYNTPYNDPAPRRLLRVDALAGTDGLPVAEEEPPSPISRLWPRFPIRRPSPPSSTPADGGVRAGLATRRPAKA